MPKIVLLNSGGKDSLAAVMLLRQGLCSSLGVGAESASIHSAYIDLGWRNSARARHAAQVLADKFCDSHLEIPVGGIAWAREHPGPRGGVRFQLVTLHSLGLMYAAAIGAQFIASGAVHGPLDLEKFPDAFSRMHANFEHDFNEMARSGATFHKLIVPAIILPVTVLHPRGDERVIWNFVKHEPLWRETVGCNEEIPCGSCAKCKLRQEWDRRAASEGI